MFGGTSSQFVRRMARISQKLLFNQNCFQINFRNRDYSGANGV